MTRNEPSEEGAKVGEMIARFADNAATTYAADFASRGMPVPQRCSTCAFRLGTHPNRCLATVSDALKCVMELHDFCCHDKDAQTPEGPQVCVGWAMIVTEKLSDPNAKPIKAPWPFVDDMKEITE